MTAKPHIKEVVEADAAGQPRYRYEGVYPLPDGGERRIDLTGYGNAIPTDEPLTDEVIEATVAMISENARRALRANPKAYLLVADTIRDFRNPSRTIITGLRMVIELPPEGDSGSDG